MSAPPSLPTMCTTPWRNSPTYARRTTSQAISADAFTRMLAGAGSKPQRGPDPITLLKATKNHAEIVGSRAAHKRDGAAVVHVLAWFDREAPSGKLTEINAV